MKGREKKEGETGEEGTEEEEGKQPFNGDRRGKSLRFNGIKTAQFLRGARAASGNVRVFREPGSISTTPTSSSFSSQTVSSDSGPIRASIRRPDVHRDAREPVMSGSVMPCPSANTSHIFPGLRPVCVDGIDGRLRPKPLLLNGGFFLLFFLKKKNLKEGRDVFFPGGLRHPWNEEDRGLVCSFSTVLGARRLPSAFWIAHKR